MTKVSKGKKNTTREIHIIEKKKKNVNMVENLKLSVYYYFHVKCLNIVTKEVKRKHILFVPMTSIASRSNKMKKSN